MWRIVEHVDGFEIEKVVRHYTVDIMPRTEERLQDYGSAVTLCDMLNMRDFGTLGDVEPHGSCW
jgi:hypothetical protein